MKESGLSAEDRAAMIETLSVMNMRPSAYYADMTDRRIVEEYQRLLKLK